MREGRDARELPAAVLRVRGEGDESAVEVRERESTQPLHHHGLTRRCGPGRSLRHGLWPALGCT
eukprot:329830-Pleurochrysis_carterae.AAC.1